ncbi:hypothetical protein [Microbacterium arborescens]|uniref:hypothetical protein n=1 Tax=Microbacterium arborescens TaxID=33883 RepID=UPI003C72BE59
MPRMDVHTSTSPGVPGAIITGYELPPRAVYWPLRFANRSIPEWEDEHAGFFDSFHPALEGVWTVGEGGDARTLPLTGSFDGTHSFERDPFVTGKAVIGVQLLAPRPLWRGRPIRRQFKAPEPSPFYPGPPFMISSGASYGNATIPNPGQEPSYVTWEIDGPHPAGVKVGVGDALVEVPFEIPAGRRLVINTDPSEQYARVGDLVDDGAGVLVLADPVDAARDLGFQIFAPIPARGDVSLTLVTAGTGVIAASHTPLYWRAF